MSTANEQSIDEHMVKFKGRSGMKPYIKSKPIKWGFKFWFRCASKTGYLYEMDMYLGKKEKETEYNLGESVVIKLCESLKGTFCTIFFDNFFSSPNLIKKLHADKIYGVGTVRSNRKNMPRFKPDKEMKRGDCQFLFSQDVVCCKWMDNRSVTMIATNVEGCNSLATVQRRAKGAANKITVNCPTLVKQYNSGMGGVDLMDQRTAAYRLDRRSKVRFYLRIFFDLLDIACVNSFIVYNKLNPNQLNMMDFKVIVAERLIGAYNSRERNYPVNRPNKRQRLTVGLPEKPQHLPIFQGSRQ